MNTEATLHWNTEYSSDNETSVHQKWMNEIPWESGIIALSKAEVKRFGLPESQPFPWDYEEKRIYIVNAHHILHCVVSESHCIRALTIPYIPALRIVLGFNQVLSI